MQENKPEEVKEEDVETWNPLIECQTFKNIKELAEQLIPVTGASDDNYVCGYRGILEAAMAYVRWVLPEDRRDMLNVLTALTWPEVSFVRWYEEAFRKDQVPREAYDELQLVCKSGFYMTYAEGAWRRLLSLAEEGK